jgi:hypothetical protein
VIPSHAYQYFAHSAPGRDLHEYLLGASAGGVLDEILPGSYVQLTYDYAFVEPVAGINLNRSDFGFELGYFLSFLTPSLGLRFLATGYYTHGGVPYHLPSDLPPELYPHHDQIVKAVETNVGGGLSYVLTGSTEVYVSYLQTVYGRGGHKIDHGLNFGFTWSFSPKQLIRRYFAKSARSAEEP